MGTNVFVRIMQNKALSVLWFVARKGRKPAALNTSQTQAKHKPIKAILNKLQTEWQQDTSEDKSSLPHQLIIDHFWSVLKSFDHSIMCWELALMKGAVSILIAQSKHLYTVDHKTLLSLNGGGSWARNFKPYTVTMNKSVQCDWFHWTSIWFGNVKYCFRQF